MKLTRRAIGLLSVVVTTLVAGCDKGDDSTTSSSRGPSTASSRPAGGGDVLRFSAIPDQNSTEL